MRTYIILVLFFWKRQPKPARFSRKRRVGVDATVTAILQGRIGSQDCEAFMGLSFWGKAGLR